MKVELLVSEWCPTCPAAEQVWREVAAEREFEFAVVDAAQPEGRSLVARLHLRSVPSVVIDGVLRAVGVQTPEEARALVAEAPARSRRHRAYHAGMMLSRDNRLWIVAATAYLAACALILADAGSLLPDGTGRSAAVHLFGGGFVLFLVFGLAAHMLPRFTGNPIAMAPWTWVQLGAANAGLPLLAIGLWLRLATMSIVGGALLCLALAVFAGRILPVLLVRSGAARGTPEAGTEAL
ncbi:MAG: thioredoxin family protein [Burkholderiales bacterium]|nr:thioredoxin family protein [Burkholderiales bacterium]